MMGNSSATTRDVSTLILPKANAQLQPYVFARKPPPTGFTKALEDQVLADNWIE
jgi:hypothetical protein